MRILVVDDDKRHHESAVKLLGTEHELEIVSDPDEAIEKLEPRFDEEKEATLLIAAGFPKGFEPWDDSVSKEERRRYYDEQEKAHEASRLPFPYDAVLLDLLMPATRNQQGHEGSRLVGELMPYGYSLALFAIQNGASKVAILTETNHHQHPMSAALDGLKLGKVMSVNGSSFLLARELSVKLTHDDAVCADCGGSGKRTGYGKESNCWLCDGSGKETIYAKDWAKLLELLMGKAE